MLLGAGTVFPGLYSSKRSFVICCHLNFLLSFVVIFGAHSKSLVGVANHRHVINQKRSSVALGKDEKTFAAGKAFGIAALIKTQNAS